MKIYEYSENLNTSLSASVVALGLFDGVHKGHRALLASAKSEAQKRGLPLVVFTFFAESKLPKSNSRLYSTKVKSELLEKCGVEYVIYADFAKIANVDAESFVRDILIDKCKAKLAVTGSDFKFGKDRAGDAKLLASLMNIARRECLLVPDFELLGKKISTSIIKELLSEGKPKLAAELLGEAYFIDGKIMHGDGRGATLGLPTVNIYLQNNSNFIKRGVYYSKVDIDGKSYTGLTNIGKCPTFEEREVHLETFILDFSDTVYEKEARVHLIDFLREEIKFNSKEDLINQINKDIITAKARWKDGR